MAPKGTAVNRPTMSSSSPIAENSIARPASSATIEPMSVTSPCTRPCTRSGMMRLCAMSTA